MGNLHTSDKDRFTVCRHRFVETSSLSKILRVELASRPRLLSIHTLKRAVRRRQSTARALALIATSERCLDVAYIPRSTITFLDVVHLRPPGKSHQVIQQLTDYPKELFSLLLCKGKHVVQVQFLRLHVFSRFKCRCGHPVKFSLRFL